MHCRSRQQPVERGGGEGGARLIRDAEEGEGNDGDDGDGGVGGGGGGGDYGRARGCTWVLRERGARSGRGS